MKAFSSFSQCWGTLQAQITAGQKIPPWSVAGRAKKDEFTVLATHSGEVIVQPGNGEPRRIPRSEFEKVFDKWTDYKARNIQRYELGFTQHSTYIISIFHWLEIQN